MLSALIFRKSAGFSLIELMVSVVVLGVLASIAVPSFQAWIRNTQIRNAAESITNGLQRARAEAVSRNTNTSFVMGTDSSWTISVVNPALTIDQRLASEGSKNVTRTVLPNGATTVTFSNVGLVVANADLTNPITQVDLVAAGGSQNLRVTIGTGGNARMCDPNMASGSSPRAC
jgi:type IV fimbrial biogenesis protein FimT